MRMVQATTLSSIDDYRIIDADPPEPGPGEVLFDVAACGVGYVDALVALGRYQVKPPLPHTPGQEAAGRVAKVGPDVAGPAQQSVQVRPGAVRLHQHELTYVDPDQGRALHQGQVGR